jgi:hypothetical protein
MTADAPPQTIGRRYLLHERLGVGGMGAVYRATDRLTGDAVALKRMTAPAEDGDPLRVLPDVGNVASPGH